MIFLCKTGVMMLQISFNGERLKEARLFNKKVLLKLQSF